MKPLKPYEIFSEVYSRGWGSFSLRYLKYIRLLRKKYSFVPKTILDISCGTGELIKRLKKDYKVMGSDISPQMLAIARRNNPEIKFTLSDMVDLRLKKKFDLVISAFDSLNYIMDNERLKMVFENIHGLLKPGGFFLFDINTHHLYDKLHSGTVQRNVDGVRFSENMHYDPETRTAETVFDFGDNVKEEHLQKGFYIYEIMELMKDKFTVLKTVDLFRIFQFITPGNNSYKVLFMAKKTGV